VIVCLLLPDTALVEPEPLLHAADSATRPTVSPIAPTRQRVDLPNALMEPI
jgi:hypothetical protein